MSAVVHPRVPPRRGATRPVRWWARAWTRAVEEAAYNERDLTGARTLARSGRVGSITTDAGAFAATVEDGPTLWTVTGTVPLLDPTARMALVETVAADASRIDALLGGDLPYALVEHAEEAGVELLPYGAELGSACSCPGWTDPCLHALAVLHQLAWIVEADPFVLLQLRGLSRDLLLAELHERAGRGADRTAGGGAPASRAGRDDDLETGVEAALRAARVLELLGDPESSVDHLF